MFDKRLFQLAPGLKKLIAGKVALMWVGLLANIGFMLSLVMLLNSLLTAVAPPLLQCGGTSQGAACPVPLSDRHGADVLPMAGDVMIYVLFALVCIAVRYTATTHATRLGTEAAERVKLALRSKLYRKMVALGPSYKTRIKTSDVVQSAGEGVEQIQSFFELFLPQLFYAILAPITLFVAIAPINVPAAAVMLVCAPFIIIVTGIVSMTAARAFGVKSMNGAIANRRQRIFHETGLIERVTVQRDLDVHLVGHGQCAVNSGGRGTPVFMDFQANCARGDLLAQGVRI